MNDCFPGGNDCLFVVGATAAAAVARGAGGGTGAVDMVVVQMSTSSIMALMDVPTMKTMLK
jgi:hypothetical protein